MKQSYIIGVDEAGRGAIAGPLVAAAVAFPVGMSLEDLHFEGVRDSKMITPRGRERLYERITSNSNVYCGVGVADARLIEDINVLQATVAAMHNALRELQAKLHCTSAEMDVVIDGNYFHTQEFPRFTTVVRGDKTIPAISAASIVAKVTRDHWMRDIAHKQFPQYNFARHKGYGTAAHRESVLAEGVCVLHRKTFLGHWLSPKQITMSYKQ